MTANIVPIRKMPNGLEIPVIGLGTWKSMDHDVRGAVQYAISCGYRHIDTALLYGNEKDVGEAIKASIDNGTVKREELFITTKLWNTFHDPDLVIPAIKKSLENLQLEYVDLYLIHFPVAYKSGGDLYPKDDNGDFLVSDVSFISTYKAMEKAVDEGLVRSIGCSNFNSKQVKRIIDECRIKPVMNQVECHPYFPNSDLLRFCKEHNVEFTAYSPLASPERSWKVDGEQKIWEDDEVISIGKKYGKSAAQVALRWNIQRGVIVIPKSVTPSRIKENIDVFDFELSDDDMKIMSSLEKGRRFVLHWGGVDKHPDYPFNELF